MGNERFKKLHSEKFKSNIINEIDLDFNKLDNMVEEIT
jgi:hypothetical protein